MNQDYKKAYEAVQLEMAEIEGQRQLLERRYARLKQTSLSLETLMEDENASGSDAAIAGLPVVGLTDACRHALKVSKSPRTAGEVRDWLEGSGYDLSEQENALASIHTILKRLVASGEAEPGTSKDGKASYKWKSNWRTYLTEQRKPNRPYNPVAMVDEENRPKKVGK